MLSHLHHSLDNAVTIFHQQFKCIGSFIQTEPVRDHEIRLDPAFVDQVDYRINALVLSSDIYKVKTFAARFMH